MNFYKILVSKAGKFLLLLLIFLIGAFSVFLGLRSMLFFEQYDPGETVFTNTKQFISLYKQYVDRAAVYTRYREAGYEPEPAGFYSKTDLISMLNGKLAGNLIPSGSVYQMNQESFEYYNYVLNGNNPDFFYYAFNPDTKKFYYNEAMTERILTSQGLAKNTMITSEILDNFFESYVKPAFPYLVLNTSYRMFYTNITGNRGYTISEDTMNFAMNYLSSGIYYEDFEEKNRFLLNNNISIKQTELENISRYFDVLASELFDFRNDNIEEEETLRIRKEASALLLLYKLPDSCIEELLSVSSQFAVTEIYQSLSQKNLEYVSKLIGTDYISSLTDIYKKESAKIIKNPGSQITEEDSDFSIINSENSSTESEASPASAHYLLYTGYLKASPGTESVFSELEDNFNLHYTYYEDMLRLLPWTIGGLLLLLSISILVTGRKPNLSGIHTTSLDRIPYEILLAGTIAVIFLVVYIFLFFTQDRKFSGLLSESSNLYPSLLWVGLIYTILFSVSAAFFITTLRRLKSYTWLQNFLILRFCRFLLKNFLLALKRFGSSILCCLRKTKTHFRNLFLEKSTVSQVVLGLVLFGGYFSLTVLISASYRSFSLCLLLSMGGVLLAGFALLRPAGDLNVLRQVTRKLTAGDLNAKAPSQESLLFRELTENINHIGNGLAAAVEEQLKSERMKTELITNVSHDIKTPLTSIINYVDLLKKTGNGDETTKNYLKVLEEKSWRLKTLIEDLVEVSKASSGTLSLQPERLNLSELVKQACGEFEDRLADRNLELVLNLSKTNDREEEIPVIADGRSTYRIIENLLSNVNKYAMSGTRVYVETYRSNVTALLSIKNISAAPLNISSDELMERFVRGDLSRNTEGSGLGLSIAKNLAKLQHGSFELYLDGDLFKAIVTLPLYLEDLTAPPES